MIVVEVELPIEKVPGGSDAKRVSENWCSTMRGGTQAYNLWTDGDRLVVTVLCPVIESNLYAHLQTRKGAEALVEPVAARVP